MNNEQLQQHESVRASEMFVNTEELLRLTSEAMADGTITTSLAKPEDNGRADIVPGIGLTSEEVDVRMLDASQRKYIQGTIDKLPLVSPERATAKTMEFINKRVADTTFGENQWHLKEPSLEKDLEEGSVSELYEFSIGEGKSILLVNFTERLLTEEQLSSINEVVKRMTALSGGTTFLKTNAICIQKAERFRNDTVGSARGMSGAILLSEKLLDGTFDGEEFKFSDVGASPLESTLTHEFMHLIELNGKNHAYGDATGWQSRHEKLVDDYGNALDVHREILQPPLVAQETIDGVVKKIPAAIKYGHKAVFNAKPVTGYGYKNDREDLAEAAVAYTYTSRDDYDSLDVIRRDAVTKVLQDSATEHGPFNVTMNKLPLTTKIGATIQPRHFIIAEPNYTYMEIEETSTEHEKENDKAYMTNMNTFTDDYGNEQTVYNKHVPRTS